MRARLIINEIRRGGDLPLGTMGVGRSGVHPAYAHAMKKYPNTMNQATRDPEWLSASYVKRGYDAPYNSVIKNLLNPGSTYITLVGYKADFRSLGGWLDRKLNAAPDLIVTEDNEDENPWKSWVSNDLGAAKIKFVSHHPAHGPANLTAYLIRVPLTSNKVNEIKRASDTRAHDALGIGRTAASPYEKFKVAAPEFARDYVVALDEALQLEIDRSNDNVKDEVRDMIGEIRDALQAETGGHASDLVAFDDENIGPESLSAALRLFGMSSMDSMLYDKEIEDPDGGMLLASRATLTRGRVEGTWFLRISRLDDAPPSAEILVTNLTIMMT